MVHNIKSRVLRGVVGQGFSQVVTIIIQFASVPIFLAYWGVDLYGEWLLLSAIPTFLLMSDLGFGGTAAREMAMLVSGGNRDKALSVFQSVWILVTLLSIVLVLISGIVLSLMPIVNWFNFSMMQNHTVNIVLVLMVTQVIFHLQGQLVYAGYNSEGHYGLGTIWLTSIRLIEFAAQMLVVIAGYGPYEVVAAALMARGASTVFMRINLKKIAPWIIYGTRYLRWQEIQRLTVPAVSALAFPVGQALNLQGARIIVGIVLGPPAVVTFTALRTLSRFIAMSLSLINRISQPEISFAYGKNDIKMLRRLYRRTCQLTLWGSLTFCIIMYLIGNYIFEIWTAGKLIMDKELFIIMLIASAIQALWATAMLVLYATNRHSKVAITFIVVNAVFLLLSYYMLLYFGIAEMMMALTACELMMLIFILPNSLKFTGDSLSRFLSEIIRPPLFLVALITKHEQHSNNKHNQ